MRLHKFISKNMEAILKEWEDFARENQPSEGDMQVVELRDHAKAMLHNIIRDMETAQSEIERKAKSQGNGPASSSKTAAEVHADDRLGSGFSIDLVVAEYRALRASVLRLWFNEEGSLHQQGTEHMEDLIRFNEAIDQSLAESVAQYSEAVTKNSDIFIGMLGHDLRSPLQVLGFGAAKLKTMEDATSSLSQLGSTMVGSVRRMREMLDNLMDFTESRIGDGLRINLAPTDMAEICGQLIEEFRSSHDENVFKHLVTGDCTGTWDASRIGQICQNLISNALQHGEPGGEILVGCEGNEGAVVLTVKSSGKPIPESQHQKIFELATRMHHKDGNPNRNSGLGLYIVKKLVKAHQGKITLESLEAAGTTFRVELPRAVSAAPERQ